MKIIQSLQNSKKFWNGVKLSAVALGISAMEACTSPKTLAGSQNASKEVAATIKHNPENAFASMTTDELRAIDIMDETKFNAGILSLTLPGGKADLAAATKLLEDKGYGETVKIVDITGGVKGQQEYAVMLKEDAKMTEDVKRVLKQGGFLVCFDQKTGASGQVSLLTNDPNENSYGNPGSGGILSGNDTLRANTPLSYRDGQDQAGENGKLVLDEHGDPMYLVGQATAANEEVAAIDTANSLNLYLNNQNFSSPLLPHGVAVSHAAELENNNKFSWGNGIVGKTIVNNVVTASGNYSATLQVALINRMTAYLTANPTHIVVMNWSHQTPAQATPGYETALDAFGATGGGIISHAAGNGNTTALDWIDMAGKSYVITSGSTDGFGIKAPTSNRGPNITLYHKGKGVRSLALGGGSMIQVDGTSFVSNEVAGFILRYWMQAGGKAVYTPAQIKQQLIDGARNFVVQPDNTQKPFLDMWNVQNRNMDTLYKYKQNASSTPGVLNATLGGGVLDLHLATQSARYPQIGVASLKYYIKVGASYTLIPGGILDLNQYGNGVKEIKVAWDNSGTPTILDGNNQPTSAEVKRNITIINAVPPPAAPGLTVVTPQCAADTLRATPSGIEPGNTVEGRVNGQPMTYDPGRNLLYKTPNPVGNNVVKAIQKRPSGTPSDTTTRNETTNAALVPALDPINITINGGGSTYCTGQTINLTTVATNVAGASILYTWKDGATVLGTSATPNFSTTLGTAGAKNYTCTVTFVPPANSCYSTTTATSPVATINVGQTAAPTGDVSPNTAAICANTAQNINYTVAGQNGLIYTYTKHLINPAGVDQNIGTMAAPGTYSTGVLVTPGTWKTYVEATLTGGPNPCASSVYRSDTATITVNLNTAADGTITGPAAVCENSSINYSLLVNSNVPAGSTVNIMKQVGSGAWVQIGTATTTQPPVAITGSTAAGLPTTRIRGDIVVSAPGCVTNGISDTLTVAGNAIPAAPTAVPTQPTCAIPTGSITVAAGPAGTTYSFNNGVSYQSSNASGALAPGNYQVKVKSPAGCESTATTVTINAAPTVPANPINQVTQPDCIVSTGGILITNPVAGQEYSFNGGTTWTTATSSGPLTPGTYNVMTRNATCTSGMVPTTINAQPVTPAVPTINAPAGNVLSIASPVAGVTYQWQFSATQNGTYANIATGTSYTATQSGRYRAIAQGTACNSAPSSAQQMIITGIGNPNNPNNLNIRVYPNPVHNTLTIDSIPLTYKVSLVIYDAAGRTVMPARQLTQVNNRASVDIAHLPAGIYFIGIYDMKNDEYIKKGIKVIKQ